MRQIYITDLKKQYKLIRSEINSAIGRVLASQQFILGKETEKFEKSFAKYCEGEFCVALGSGTDALYVALKCMGIKPGDEVIVPVFTFIATAEAVDLLEGKVVFCDVDPDTGLIDLDDFEKKISKKTKFVIPVHLYGQIGPMKEIISLAKKHSIKIIEDAAQAHGGTYKGNRSPISQLATYSFYPSKNLGAFGDAGAIVTKSKRLYKKMTQLRNHGQKSGEKYHHHSIGYNFRIDEIQATVLRVKLKYLNKWLKRRQKLAKLYDKQLAKVEGIEIIKKHKNITHAYHLYCIKVKRRDKLLDFLTKRGIQARVHYPIPLHLQPAYKYLGYKKDDFPGAEEIAKEVLSLPLYPELTERELVYICEAVKSFIKKK